MKIILFFTIIIFIGCGSSQSVSSIPNSSTSTTPSATTNGSVDFPAPPTGCGNECPPSFTPPS